MKTVFKAPNGKNIFLVDAQETARKHPDTFEAPSIGELLNLGVGDFVKLSFNDEERMWVKITKVGDELTDHEGELNNDPFIIGDLHLGDRVPFKMENVYIIMKKNACE